MVYARIMISRMKMKWLLILLLGCVAVASRGQTTPAVNLPRVFSVDPQALAANKAALAAGDKSLDPARQRLLEEADRDLSQKPLSVMDKPEAPPSGDKHDFVSWAPYYWRDTNSPGKGYIRRDGERNPETADDSDSGHFQKTCAEVHTLALAFYFTGDEKYAAKATEFIRVWFLNPATRMNPNLNYGQGVRGEVTGRPEGLISARGLVGVMDAIGLLAGSKTWTPADQQGMVDWSGQYFDWLTTSKIGQGEGAASNNHGTYYDGQAVALALFTGKTEAAKKILLAARTKRIAGQIRPDGRMPRELGRTLSFSYSTFNLQALMILADLGKSAGVDLWHYQTSDGRSILKATEFMAIYADPARHWPYEQIHPPNRNDLAGPLLNANAEFPESHLQEDLKFFRPNELAANQARLTFKTPPLTLVQK
jgi:hypothetical protein